jgi:hypothetical protein
MREQYFSLVLGGQHVVTALLLALAPVGVVLAQAPSWRVATAGSPTQAGGTSQTMATAVDANGNVLVAGYFAGSVTFGPTTLTSAGGNDLFVAKWVPGNGTGTGSWAWAQGAGGSGDDQAAGLAVRSTSVYVTGYITNTAADAAAVRFGNRAVAGATGTSSTDLVLACYTDQGTSATRGRPREGRRGERCQRIRHWLYHQRPSQYQRSRIRECRSPRDAVWGQRHGIE